MIKKSTLVLALLAGTTSLAHASDNSALAEYAGTAVTQMQCSSCNSVYTSEKDFEGIVYRIPHNCMRDHAFQNQEDKKEISSFFGEFSKTESRSLDDGVGIKCLNKQIFSLLTDETSPFLSIPIKYEPINYAKLAPALLKPFKLDYTEPEPLNFEAIKLSSLDLSSFLLKVEGTEELSANNNNK